jgi:transcriptional regulator with XRE-family HTH domain
MMRTTKRPCSYCDGTGLIDISALHALRLDRKLSQEDVALAMGISRQAYTNIELGNAGPSVRGVRELAKVLRITADQLLEILLGEVKQDTNQ